MNADTPPDTPPDSPPTFEAQLADLPANWTGACSGRGLNPSQLAAELLTQDMPVWDGPWLACYMLRRFGWPNLGSDDYKQFMSWVLTTPMTGVFLTVTPYMGCHRDKNFRASEKPDARAALHFGFVMSHEIAESVDPPEAEVNDHFLRQRAFWQQWWNAGARDKFAMLACHPDENQTLVERIGDDEDKNDGHVFGFYRRHPSMLTQMQHAKDRTAMTPQEAAAFLNQPLEDSNANGIVYHFLWKDKEEQAASLTLLGIDPASYPRMNREKLAEQRAENERLLKEPVRDALRATLKDLLRATYVRDVYFNAQRRVPDDELETTDTAGYFKGAGHTPKYWFEEGQC